MPKKQFPCFVCERLHEEMEGAEVCERSHAAPAKARPSLYRVTHRLKTTGTSYTNSVVAGTPAEAITLREIALDLDECDPAFEVEIEAVADPDGSRAASWLAHFGSEC